MENNSELTRLQQSADFWRNRSNAFELALREIVAAKSYNCDELASDIWEIAHLALKKQKN